MVGEEGVDREVANCLIVKLTFKKNVGDHVCEVYKKCLPSRKALGGHMRIHNEELEDGKQHKVVVHGGHGKREVEVHHLSSTTCKVCYREYPSKKSLFRHMRCHPERERSGINPPPSYPLPPPPPPSPPLKNSSLSGTIIFNSFADEVFYLALPAALLRRRHGEDDGNGTRALLDRTESRKQEEIPKSSS